MSRKTAGDGSDGPNSMYPASSKHGARHPYYAYLTFQDPNETQGPLSSSRGNYGTSESGIRIAVRPTRTKMRFLVLSAVIFFLVGYHAQLFFDLVSHMKQRHEWDLEEKRHNIKREKWEEDFQRKQRLEEQKHNLVRKEWEGKRVAFREKQRLEEENRKTVRKVWEEEHSAIHNDRKRWDQERKTKEDQERYEKDEESRKRRGIAWDGFQALGCLRYETRQYTATLVNVPLGFNAVDECQKKAIQIHGRDLFPSRCED